MSEKYLPRPMAPADVDQAFALVQLIAPNVTLDRWRNHFAEVCGLDAKPPPRKGMEVLEGPGGYFHGLFAYHPAADLTLGRTLRVEDFVVLALFDRLAAARAMTRRMEQIARELECRAVTVHYPPDHPRHGSDQDLRQFLLAQGHMPWFQGYCKTLPESHQ